jgi:hypothetical protein
VLVKELASNEATEYERFVRNHPHALTYYSLRFRDLLLELLDCQSRYAVAWCDGEIVGVLPLMIADGAHGLILNSLPFFGSNGGILATDGRGARSLERWYGSQVSAPGVVAGTVIANPVDPDPAAMPHTMGDTRIGMVTRLQWFEPCDRDQAERYLLDLVDGSARRNLNKALRSGVEVAVDNDAFAALQAIHVANMTATGGRTKSPSFFAAVPRCLTSGEDYNLYVGMIGEDIVAALLVLYYASSVEYYVPAIRAEYRSLQPLAAILRTAMIDAMTQGRVLWNWGGSWVTQDNLIRFKGKWGGQPRTYQYWTQLNEPDLIRGDPDEILAAYPGFFVAPFRSVPQTARLPGTAQEADR